DRPRAHPAGDRTIRSSHPRAPAPPAMRRRPRGRRPGPSSSPAHRTAIVTERGTGARPLLARLHQLHRAGLADGDLREEEAVRRGRYRDAVEAERARADEGGHRLAVRVDGLDARTVRRGDRETEVLLVR